MLILFNITAASNWSLHTESHCAVVITDDANRCLFFGGMKLKSRCGVAPHSACFADRRVHWLPRGTDELGRPTGLTPAPADSRSAVLLLHHGHQQTGASDRNCTDVVGFTKAVPGLSRPQRQTAPKGFGVKCSRRDSHPEPSRSQRDVQISYTSRTKQSGGSRRSCTAPFPFSAGRSPPRASEPLVLPHGNAP